VFVAHFGERSTTFLFHVIIRKLVDPVASPQRGARFVAKGDSEVEAQLDTLRKSSYRSRPRARTTGGPGGSRRRCSQRRCAKCCCCCCYRTVLYSKCWAVLCKLFVANERAHHASEVRIVSADNSDTQQDVRLYNKQRSCVNDGMIQELEKALLVCSTCCRASPRLVDSTVIFGRC